MRLKRKIDILKNNIFKQSHIFRLSLYLMIILNVLYVSIAIYKSKISAPLLGKSNITADEFAEVLSLTKYTSFLEVVFIALSLGTILLVFTKKYKQLQKSYVVIQLIVLISIFLINEVLAWIFNAPAGDVSQNLIGPFAMTFWFSVYLIIKNTYLILRESIKT